MAFLGRQTWAVSAARLVAGVFSGLMVVVIAGCSTMHLPKYVGAPLETYENRGVEAGLAVAVRPLSGSAEVKKYFGTDLLGSKVLPVFVVAENRSKNAAYLIGPGQFTLLSPEVELTADQWVDVDAGRKAGEVIDTVGGLAVSIPLTMLGSYMVSNATEVKRNLEVKQLRRSTISPGKKAEGFVYFPLRNGTLKAGNLRVRVEFMDARSHTPGFLEIPIELGGR